MLYFHSPKVVYCFVEGSKNEIANTVSNIMLIVYYISEQRFRLCERVSSWKSVSSRSDDKNAIQWALEKYDNNILI